MAPLARRVAAWLADSVWSGALALPIVAAAPAQWPRVHLALGVALLGLVVLAAFDASFRGQTPGKMLMRIQVRSANDGDRISLGRGLLRRSAYFAGGGLLMAGWLLGLANRRRRTLHDLAAGTVVVDHA